MNQLRAAIEALPRYVKVGSVCAEFLGGNLISRDEVLRLLDAAAPALPAWEPVPPRACIRPTHEAADAFWKYWRENGETHKHGYYESTWGAINAALASGWDAVVSSPPSPSSMDHGGGPFNGVHQSGAVASKPEAADEDRAEFEVWEGEGDETMVCASASGPRSRVWQDVLHYAAQYAQDGPVRVCEVTRRWCHPSEIAPAASGSEATARSDVPQGRKEGAPLLSDELAAFSELLWFHGECVRENYDDEETFALGVKITERARAVITAHQQAQTEGET